MGIGWGGVGWEMCIEIGITNPLFRIMDRNLFWEVGWGGVGWGWRWV